MYCFYFSTGSTHPFHIYCSDCKRRLVASKDVFQVRELTGSRGAACKEVTANDCDGGRIRRLREIGVHRLATAKMRKLHPGEEVYFKKVVCDCHYQRSGSDESMEKYVIGIYMYCKTGRPYVDFDTGKTLKYSLRSNGAAKLIFCRGGGQKCATIDCVRVCVCVCVHVCMNIVFVCVCGGGGVRACMRMYQPASMLQFIKVLSGYITSNCSNKKKNVHSVCFLFQGITVTLFIHIVPQWTDACQHENQHEPQRAERPGIPSSRHTVLPASTVPRIPPTPKQASLAVSGSNGRGPSHGREVSLPANARSPINGASSHQGREKAENKPNRHAAGGGMFYFQIKTMLEKLACLPQQHIYYILSEAHIIVPWALTSRHHYAASANPNR